MREGVAEVVTVVGVIQSGINGLGRPVALITSARHNPSFSLPSVIPPQTLTHHTTIYFAVYNTYIYINVVYVRALSTRRGEGGREHCHCRHSFLAAEFLISLA